jgi:drug/metabolite transporter (DMT)-like permease
MAVVAPISAVLSAAVPVAWGALTDGVPPPAKLLGFAVALLGVFLVARSGPGRADRTGLALALAAGAGFGAFLVLMHTAAEQGPFWPLVLARSTSLTLVLGAALLARRPFAPTAAALPMALASGLLDTAGNTLFVLAGRAGRLDTAAVLSSMYPVSTVLLAAALLRERVRRAQAVGIGLTLLAIVLIAG